MTSNWQKVATSGLVLALAGGAFAGRQFSPPVIDGNISDINSAGQQNQTVGGSFGVNNEALNLRVSNDDTNLYVGIASRLDAASGGDTRGIWIILDSKPGGVNTINTNSIGSAPGGSKGLDGVVMEAGFAADYVYFMQNGDGGNRQNYFLNTQDLQNLSDSYYGVFDVTGNTFTSNGAPPVGFLADVDNTEAAANPADAATATRGLEFQIPLSAIGATPSSAESINIMVGMGDGGSGYFSNQTLPTSKSSTNLGGGAGNSPKVNFETDSYGAFTSPGGFSDEQSYSMQLPVSLSGFTLE